MLVVRPETVAELPTALQHLYSLGVREETGVEAEQRSLGPFPPLGYLPAGPVAGTVLATRAANSSCGKTIVYSLLARRITVLPSKYRWL